MSTRIVPLAVNEFYHLYNRGVDKRTIFQDESDQKRFLALLYLCNSSIPISLREILRGHTSAFEFETGEPLVAIGAYCLMPNHFHVLATPLIEGGLTTFMAKLGTAYSMYFNKKYERTGALFQGTFKSQHANSDEYLKYLFSYIHLNPVKLIDAKWREQGSDDAAKSFDFAASYPYSSLQDHLGCIRDENKIINKTPFPEYFVSATDIEREIFSWLKCGENEIS